MQILYTTDSGAMSGRSYSLVTGMTNGFMGTELLDAVAVNSNGTVVAENQSLVEGWASLSFNAVNATGIAIGFQSAASTYNHMKLHEIQAHFDNIPVDAGFLVWSRDLYPSVCTCFIFHNGRAY